MLRYTDFAGGGGGSEAYIVLYKDFQGGEGGGIIQNYIRVVNHFDKMCIACASAREYVVRVSLSGTANPG